MLFNLLVNKLFGKYLLSHFEKFTFLVLRLGYQGLFYRKKNNTKESSTRLFLLIYRLRQDKDIKLLSLLFFNLPLKTTEGKGLSSAEKATPFIKKFNSTKYCTEVLSPTDMCTNTNIYCNDFSPSPMTLKWKQDLKS